MPEKKQISKKGLFHEEAFLLARPIQAFETFRLWDGNFLNIGFHYERLLQSCEIIGIPYPKEKEFLNMTNELKRNYGNGYRFRINVLPDGNLNSVVREFLLPEEIHNGVNIKTFYFDRIEPKAKYDSPMYNYFRKTQSGEIWETVLTDRLGNITEGSRTNIICLQGDNMTIPKKETYLEGTMLRFILENTEYEIIERDISVSELNSFDAVILTNSLYGIIPVKKIDDSVFEQSLDFAAIIRNRIGI